MLFNHSVIGGVVSNGTALECSNSCFTGDPRCHATLSCSKAVCGLCIMTTPITNFGEIPCCFSVGLINQVNTYRQKLPSHTLWLHHHVA